MIAILPGDRSDVIRVMTALHAVAASDPGATGYAELADEIGRELDRLPTPPAPPERTTA